MRRGSNTSARAHAQPGRTGHSRRWRALGLLGLIIPLIAGTVFACSAAARTRRHAPRHAPLRCLDRLPPGATAAAVRPRRRLSAVNPFGSAMFGIATGGGIQDEGPRLLARDIGSDRAAGARWVRVDIDWATVQMHGPHSYMWGPTDRVVRQAAVCGMSVLGTILYTPYWARPYGTAPTWAPPAGAYARFAGAAARHLARLGVHAYEIWNEPNSLTFWQPRPDPRGYVAVLRGAYRAIHRSDPGATVLSGGTAPEYNDGTNFAEVTWLSRLYDAGAHGAFDAIGYHPYCWPAFPGARDSWSAWYQMYGTRRSIRSLMVSYGDGGKRIWGTEFGAPTGGPGDVSEGTQAAMVVRAYRLFATYRWAGPLFFYQGRDAGGGGWSNENFFGFLRHDFGAKPAYAAYARTARSY